VLKKSASGVPCLRASGFTSTRFGLIGFLPPPDTYTLSVWHAGAKKHLTRGVTGESNGILSAKGACQFSVGRRSVHEMQDNPPFGLEILGEGGRDCFHRASSKIILAEISTLIAGKIVASLIAT
jgi:hypothetical protein